MKALKTLFMVLVLVLCQTGIALSYLPMEQFDVGGGGWLQSGCFHPTDPDIMVIGGDYTGGVYRSSDGGSSWVPWNDGLHNDEGEGSMYVEDLQPVVLNAGTVKYFAATHGGIYRSYDGSTASWKWSTKYSNTTTGNVL